MLQAPSSEVAICLLGLPRWRSRCHAEQPLSRHDAALLALLALEGELARDRIAAWLWPDTAIKNANINLRQHVFKLRKTCGHPLVHAGLTLRLAEGVTVDLLHLAPLPDGELLASFDGAEGDAFDLWLRAARGQLARQRLDQLVGHAAALESAGELAAAIALTERIVQAWPLHEHSWRRLMRLHYQRGDRASAIDAFERFERLVREEQGSRPSAETLALLDSVERLQPPLAPPPQPPAWLQHPPVLVGREDALAQLHAAWHSARAALVLGEGGIGKSRLLAEFVRQRPDVLLRRARPGEAASAYATAVLLLRELLTRWPVELDADTRAELARLLPNLGTAPQGDAQQVLLWQAVETLLRGACALGLQALVVDDLHFADAASLELLRWLVASPDLVVLRFAFAARPNEPGAAALLADWTGDSSRVEPVRLGPLSLPQLRQLLQSLPMPAAIPAHGLAEQAEALHRHAGGHPFYTLETIKAGWRQAPATPATPAALSAPASVQAMLERSFKGLSPAARELAAVVALAAADWQPELAVQVLQRPLLALAPVWAELEAAQLMRGHDFAHDLVRECALGLLPAAWRLSLHGQLAQAMAMQPAMDPARVAEHCWAAERWLDAARTLRQAAQHSRSAGRLAEHEAQLERAAQASARAGDAAGQFDALADAAAAAMMRLGPADAATRLQTLESLATADALQARLDLLWAEHHFNLGDYAQALQHSARAVALAPAGGTLHHDAQVVHGRALALTGRALEAVPQLRQAATAAAALGLVEQEANACAALAHALQVGGQIGLALQAQQRTVALAQARHNRAEIAHAASNLAALAYSAGATGLALIHAQEADARFQAMGASGVHRLWNRIMLARCLAASGRLDQALASLAVFDTPAAADNAGPTLPVVACVTRATVMLWQGHAEQALAVLPLDDPACMAMVRARAHAVRAQALRAMGQDTTHELAELEALAAQVPTLRDDAILALDWACHGPADLALANLRRLRAKASERGAEGLARSLAVLEVQRLREVDAAAARVLASTLADTLLSDPAADLHANLCPTNAWNVLADALAGVAGVACRGRARRWTELTVHGSD